MTRFVVLGASLVAVSAALGGARIGLDAAGTTCLGILSALGVLMVGGWIESLRLRFRPPPCTRRP
jgi:hypothetical protein